jgi:putative aldouronate transport system permease protein
MVGRNTFGNRFTDGAILVVLIIAAFVCFIPILYTISMSLSDKAAVEAGRVFLWPINFTWASYDKVLQDEHFYRAFLVSVNRVLLGGSINFVLTVVTAFALSRETKDFSFRNVYMWILVFTMLFSGGLIPWYLTIKNLGLLDTMWALVLPSAVPVYNIILLMNFFRSLPKELMEAAEIDGAGPWYILARIFVPLSLPAIATVTLFSIVGHWNSFFDGLVLMNSQVNYPLQTYIQTLVVKINAESMATMTSDQLVDLMKISNRTFNAAKIIVSMIPIVILYPFIQRFFIHGITLGSVKE